MSISNFCHNFLSETITDSKLGDVAAEVAVQNFDYRYATLVFFNTTLCYGVGVFLRVFNYNIIINRDALSANLINITRQYVLYGNDITDLQQVLETLRELEMDNTGKFIIVCQSQELHDCDENQIIELLWEYRIVNVVFIKPEKAEAFGYTYFPISDGSCNNITPIKLLNRSEYAITNMGNIFSMKLKNLSFCPLFVSTFIQSPYMNLTGGRIFGADGDLLRIIAYGLNTTLRMMTPRRGDGWGFRLKNGTWMGSLSDLSENLANISMTSPALTLTRFSDYQVSLPYSSVQVVWVTHPAMFQNEALKLLRPFTQSTRIALVVSFVIVILCAFIVKSDAWSSICGQIQKDESSKSVVFYSWMICTGQAVIKLPTKSSFLQMTYLWIYYCFIIRTAYQVYLISSLKGTFYEDQFETIEDVIRAKYPFGGGPALQDYYIDYPTVHDNWVPVDTAAIVPTLVDLSKGKQFVLACNWDTAKMVIKKHRIQLHVLPQKIINSPTGIFFKKYSPLAESINIILSRLIAAGFPEKLHKNYTSFQNFDDLDKDYEALKIIHLTACYVILLIGWSMSIIFFMLEIYIGKIYKHPNLSPHAIDDIA